ncbi:MAG TPA: C-type lectin domain-containing protein, partial [Polyangiaceae bacterium]|nr:C-type lectin domain-containing protein [Polyangiaceae bacterium]
PGLALVGACSSDGHYFDAPAHHVTLAGRGGGSGTSGAPDATGGASASGATSGGSAGSVQPHGGTGATGGASSDGGSGGTIAEGATGGEPDGTSASGGTAGQQVGGSGGTGVPGGSPGVLGGTGGSAGTPGTTDGGEGGAGSEPCVPTPEVCDGVSNDCNDAIDEGDVCPAGCSAKTFGGHTYLLCLAQTRGDRLSYQEAAQYCIDAGDSLDLDFGLELAHLESQAEDDFAKAWIAASTSADGSVWLGANDIDDEGRWVWGRGSNATEFFVGSDRGGGKPYMDAFNDFADGRPNSGRTADCGAFDSSFDWRWNDLVCDDGRLGFLCEQR